MNKTILVHCSLYGESGKNNLVMADGRIIHIGAGLDYKDFLDQDSQLLDMEGSYVFPGFVDAHAHFLNTGLNQNMIPLFPCNSIQDLVEVMKHSDTRGFLWLKGYGYDETRFKDRRTPTRKDLDCINTERPVVIFRRDYHSCVLNSYAIRFLQIPQNKMTREIEDGIIRGNMNNWVRRKITEKTGIRERKKAIERACALAAGKGITTVCALEGDTRYGNDYLEFLIREYDSAPINIVLYPQITDISWVIEKKLPRIGGCLLLDGSLGSRTAALSLPYDDEPDNYGILYYRDDFLYSFVEKAHLSGIQMSFHAIGDRAISQIVRAYERVLLQYPHENHRHRIEHCELPSEADIEKIARLGICLSVQPAFEYFWGGLNGMYRDRLGEHRSSTTNPLRRFHDFGIVVAGGSDSDVTPMDPMLGIHSAINHPHLQSSLHPEAAVDLFTVNAAKSCFLEKLTGCLGIGMRADITVLSDDPLSPGAGDIKNIDVLYTFAGGKCVYAKGKEERAAAYSVFP